MTKWWTMDPPGDVTDAGVQLYLGHGYADEYQIAKARVDARITRIQAAPTKS
jgi:alkylation response protein AidB-like acyl-CoA dehydrogenase